MSFKNLGLAEPLVRALEAKGYVTPTPIQRDAIPTVLTGRDLLGIAQTGTGKTAAFVLPSIQRLAEDQKRVLPTHCRMLVLAPTRELAGQIAESARGYGQFSKMSVATVFGGTSINKNRTDMARGVDILVATPGRLLDLIEQRFVSLATLEILVLDEADQMLDLGFIHALKRIVALVPPKRQTLFFSATMPREIGALAAEMLRDAGCSHVIVGHSERRTDCGETDAIVRAKAEAGWRAGLVPIVCIGETQAEHEAGKTLSVLESQIKGSVPAGATAAKLIVAYEPVWAIGSGKTPTVAQVAAAHAHIRKMLGGSMADAASVRLLYGGSVKAGNAAELLAAGDVDGALVGGASLDAAEFLAIAKAA